MLRYGAKQRDSQGIRNRVGSQLCFERSAEIHSGEVDRDRVSSVRAQRGPGSSGQRFATKLAQRCRSTGFRKAKLFCAISIACIFLFLNKLIKTAWTPGRFSICKL